MGCRAADMLPGRARLRRRRLVRQLGLVRLQRSAHGLAMPLRRSALRPAARVQVSVQAYCVRTGFKTAEHLGRRPPKAAAPWGGECPTPKLLVIGLLGSTSTRQREDPILHLMQ
jgi:hypothetical protein